MTVSDACCNFQTDITSSAQKRCFENKAADESWHASDTHYNILCPRSVMMFMRADCPGFSGRETCAYSVSPFDLSSLHQLKVTLSPCLNFVDTPPHALTHFFLRLFRNTPPYGWNKIKVSNGMIYGIIRVYEHTKKNLIP